MSRSELLLIAPIIGFVGIYKMRNVYADWCRKKITGEWSREYRSQSVTDKNHISFVKSDFEQMHEAVEETNLNELELVKRKIDERVETRLSNKTNIHVEENVILSENIPIILNEIKSKLLPKYGNKHDERHVRSFEERMKANKENEECGTTASLSESSSSWTMQKDSDNISFYGEIQIISDYALSERMICAPWGSGDRICMNNIPAILRYITRQTQAAFGNLGQLRHVYIEYSPTGLFYHYPRFPRGYDGLDYVVIPIRRDECNTVITMSPNARSKLSNFQEVMKHSWTSFDIDTLLETGSMMRVFGQTREKYGWGIRPGNVWFGNHNNLVNNESTFASSNLLRSQTNYLTLSIIRNAINAVSCNKWNTETSKAIFDLRWEDMRNIVHDNLKNLSLLSKHSALRLWNSTSMSNGDNIINYMRSRNTLTCKSREYHNDDSKCSKYTNICNEKNELSQQQQQEHDAAVIVLHFEGPVAKRTLWRRFTQPEEVLFGQRPSSNFYSRWNFDDHEGHEELNQKDMTIVEFFRVVWHNKHRIKEILQH